MMDISSNKTFFLNQSPAIVTIARQLTALLAVCLKRLLKESANQNINNKPNGFLFWTLPGIKLAHSDCFARGSSGLTCNSR